MPPRKNVAPSNAVRTFFCDICSKGYPRQPDYENHLRSYDHNHRERLANMKKMTARNEPERDKKRGPDLLRSLPGDGTKRTGGPRFSKIGGGGGFQKVGVAVKTEGGGEKKKEESEEPVKMEVEVKEEEMDVEMEEEGANNAAKGAEEVKEQESGRSIIDEYLAGEKSADSDEEMEGADDWEPYDFRNPSGCDRASCAGCKEEVWNEDIPDVDMRTFVKQLVQSSTADVST